MRSILSLRTLVAVTLFFATALAHAAAALTCAVSPTTATPTVNTAASFTASSSGGSGSLSYSWSYTGGTGTVSSTGGTSSASITYSSTGSKTVTVTCSRGGETASASSAVTVVDPLTCAITPSSQSVLTDVSASLTGSSTGGAGTLSYAWSFSGGTGSGSGTSASVSYSTAGTKTVSLTCTRGSSSAAATASVVVSAPVSVSVTADAGADVTIASGGTAALNGSGSTVTGTTISTYSWTSGAWSGALTGATVTTPAINNTSGATYTVTLTVTTASGATSTDTMIITVLPTNIPPVANAGSDTSIIVGGSVTLNGSASTDSDGTIVSYIWTSPAWTGSLTGVNTSATLSTAGTYVVTLTVTDNAGASVADTMTVTVAANAPPVANAGSDQSVSTGTTVTFNGSATTDGDGTIASYSWTWTGLATPLTTVAPTYAFTTAGTYTVTLTATDNLGATSTDTVVITVTNPTVSSNTFANTPMFLACTAQTSGSASSVAFNTSTLSTDSNVYLSFFTTTLWSGRLVSYPLNATTGAVSATANWDSGAVLTSRDLTASPRTILTVEGTDGVPFQWANIGDAKKNDLRTNSSGGTDDDTTAEARLNYLRGDRSNEGSGYNFRTRASRLGDIIHSTPVFVGKPEMTWPNEAPFPTSSTYSDFKNGSAKTRTKVLYVGANDGMLHGFNSSTGAEVLAYVPRSIFSTASSYGMHFLTQSNYEHRYYVDQTPTVADVFMRTAVGGAESWRTVLLGGERAGGRGIFALDVTDPSQFSEANAASIVLWEFSSSEDADMGYSFSQPTITLLNNGRWAAVFGNGPNDSGSGQAKLFILYLDGGIDGTWTYGTDYIKISTATGSTASRNGLTTPALVDTTGDGVPDRAYAGDQTGHLWVFDLSSATASSWGLEYEHGLFAANSTQPINVEAAVGYHPTVDADDSGGDANTPNIMVYFGTGSYMYSSDATDTTTQSMYGVWDSGTGELNRTDLVQQTFRSGFASAVRVLTDNSVAYTASGGSKRYGWYIDLPTTGERVVTSAALRGTLVNFNTLIPSTSPCSYGWLMSVKQENGGTPTAAVYDTNGDNAVGASDLVNSTNNSVVGVAASGELFTNGIPSKSGFLSDYQYTASTTANSGADIEVRRVEHVGGSGTGRRAWEDISNE